MKITMKKLNYLLIIFAISVISCTKTDDNVDNDFNFEIIPLNPTSEDEMKIVHTVCNYEQLKTLEINNFSILYQREFNSSMKQPCVIKNDTLILGKLQAGTYTYTYELIDISNHALSDPISYTKTGTFKIN
ncbi:MAG: hypothetical protein CVU00_13795 [Bacteroidetes bacterium HGW-Bacteroidetes-17]|jgi:hypothetical protein|nr:MAG: hypothetical protein CVU00_13795 [Bacteroidetes bacterium HGW-Bacteroidetes-17]